MSSSTKRPVMAQRFRGYLPIVVDVETAGFDPIKDALLEIAAVTVRYGSSGRLEPDSTISCHVEPFPNANLNPESLAFTGIDPFHPLRLAKNETDALTHIFKPIRQAVKEQSCTRAILVGHNPFFDLGFINAAVERTKVKRNPFHPFSTFDTATLGGLMYGQTVLARVAKASGIEWDNESAHSAVYDAERTAEVFCHIVNRWSDMHQ
ncbi:MAG TPA: ribonuclease T [Gammaproteobacteria bacterium]|nr:ribonuclease T [Gammaproteobacteria bacterium]